MKKRCQDIFEELFASYPALELCKGDIEAAFYALKECYGNGGKVMVCGNGGSAADSEHIVGELMKGFLHKRPVRREDEQSIRKAFPDDADYLVQNLQGALPAISLVSQSAVSTAFMNDVAADMAYAQQVYGYARKGDVLIGLSTSGNSANVVHAVKIARAFGVTTVGMTGGAGGKMKNLCDILIAVPSNITFKVQEYHLPVYHVLCAMIEAEYFEG